MNHGRGLLLLATLLYVNPTGNIGGTFALKRVVGSLGDVFTSKELKAAQKYVPKQNPGPDSDCTMTDPEVQQEEGGKIITETINPWPKGKIYFILSGILSKNGEMRVRLARAMMDIQTFSCIRFIYNGGRKQRSKDYVNVMEKESGCHVKGGIGFDLNKGEKILNLNLTGCRRYGTVLHELLHVAGFMHEQSRTDRDKYVKVIYNNIIEKKKAQFKIRKGSFANYYADYDLHSIMHYGKDFFGKKDKKGNVLQTMLPLRPNQDVDIGQRLCMSQVDWVRLNNYYGKQCTKSKIRPDPCY